MRDSFGNPSGKPRDQEIAGGVVAALARDGRVNSADLVKVDVEGGRVLLSGMVRSAGEKTATGELAASVPGVRAVDNELTVEMDGTIPDSELAAAVADALDRAPGVSSRHVGVHVGDGIVNLVGHVRALTEERAAIRAAGTVKGVKEVVSSVTMSEEVPVEGLPPDDATLASLAAEALAEAGLGLWSEKAKAADGVIFIEGYAASKEDRQRATQAVEAVPGVRAVRNRLVLQRSEESKDPDERLTARVIRAFHEDGRVSPSQVMVVAVGGVVYLTGQVDSIDDQVAAGQIAERVPGVHKVVNEVLNVDRTSERSDDKGHPQADIRAWQEEIERR